MSDWHSAALDATLGADLHCGDRPLGFVSRTLPYVPAHVLWYAMVPAIVARLGLPDAGGSYRAAEDLLQGSFRCTPLYVMEGASVLLPYEGAGLKALEARYLGSVYGVALDYSNRGAREGYLFETEVILGHERRGNTPTHLAGHIFWRQGEEGKSGLRMDSNGGMSHGSGKAVSLEAILGGIALGGNRSKGLGRLSRVRLDPSAVTSLSLGDGVQLPLDLGQDHPAARVPAKVKAPMALAWNDDWAGRIRGRLKPLLGRRTDSVKGPGMRSDQACLAWAPGWSHEEPDGLLVEFKEARVATISAPR